MGQLEKDFGIENAEIVQADVLDSRSIVISFSNGASAKLDSTMVKQLAMTSALEMVPPIDSD